MTITPLGALEAQKGALEKRNIGENLLKGDHIHNYIKGVCYDTVAYTRYMLGAAISPKDLTAISGQEWRARFNFLQTGSQWRGEQIEKGTAIGFQYVHNNDIFHASISLGGLRVRGDNGGKLGAGWTAAGDSDLAAALVPVDTAEHPASQGIYQLRNETTLLKVYLSVL